MSEALDIGAEPPAARAQDMREAFERYLRPEVMARLRAVNLDVVYHRAEGSRLWGTDGKGHPVEVVDFVGGFGAALFGHNHPALLQVARETLEQQRPFNAQASVRGPAGLLARALSERVCRATGQQEGFVTTLASSGAEVVEAAIKHAELERHVRHQAHLRALEEVATRARRAARLGRLVLTPMLRQQVSEALEVECLDVEGLCEAVLADATLRLGQPGKILALAGAFHGKTTGALRLTHNPAYRAPWRHLGPTVFLPPDDVAAAEAVVDGARRTFLGLTLDADGQLAAQRVPYSDVTACFVEPIQGEAGVRPVPATMLRALRRLADRAGFPLVLDEIQCGMGRTGDFLASQGQVIGDYYLLAKSLGGGIAKVGAMMVAAGRYQPEFGFLHTSTFADDDWSAAVALAALELLDQEVGAACRDKGAYLLRRLQELVDAHPTALAAVRGRGLMLGLELRDQHQSTSPLLRALSAQNLLGYFAAGHLLTAEGFRVAPSLSAQTTIRVEPPFCIERADLDAFAAAIERLAVALERADVPHLFGDQPPARGPRPVVLPIKAAAPAARKVGFLANLMAPEDLRHLDPGLGALAPAACADFLERTRGLLQPIALPPVRVRSPDGGEVDLHVIAVPFTCDQAVACMRAGQLEQLAALVREGVALARGLGCQVLGFGGYTSIVTDNCRAIAEDHLALTSGNSLTVHAGVEALWRGLGREGEVIGVVGATGNIGAMLAELVSERAGEVVLFGRKGSGARLERVRPRLRCPSRVETDLEGLRACAGVLSASNAPSPIIWPAHLAGGVTRVICDLAVPQDVAPAVAAQVRVIRGGLLRLPLGQDLGIGGLSPEPGCVYACLAESLAMGFSGQREHLSYGALDRQGVALAGELAARHGFLVGGERE
jgi:acetylornithine/succinyldiaminopimelate/putrescine aminotransferase/predicted amino acid dehydrogenase